MNRPASKIFAAGALVFVLSSCATVGGGAASTVALVDGTKGLDNFVRIGDANWTAADGAIQATQGTGPTW